LRRIGASLLALGRSRFELFTVEWQEEKLRLLDLCLWFVVTAGLVLAGLLVTLAALALWLWHAAGYAGLIGLAVATLGAAAGFVLYLRNKIKTGPTPFPQTVAEFRKDGECLRRKN
jgi:uncharacterized membrane protein YqjE